MIKKHHTMDRHLVAAEQEHELDAVVKKMQKEGLTVITRDHVREAVAVKGRSRRKVYKFLREKYGTDKEFQAV